MTNQIPNLTRRLADLGITVIGHTETHIWCTNEHGHGWERVEHVERGLDAAEAIIGSTRDARMERLRAFHQRVLLQPYHIATRPTVVEAFAQFAE